MTFAITLLAVGVTDMGRLIAQRWRMAGRIASGVWLLLLLIGSSIWAQWWHGLIAVVIAGAWWFAEELGMPWRGPALVVALTALLGLDLALADGADAGVFGSVRWVLIAGSLVFLINTANLIVRSVLELTGRADTGGATASTLRGGRIIGPLERLTIYVLALAGAQGIVAALIAAKGIVRFPEISADRKVGARAEEFLIGSLSSWGLAGALAAIQVFL